MKRLQHAAFIALVIVLLAFLAVFPVLTFDAIGKLLSRAATLEPGNFILVLYLELSRAFTTVVAILAAVSLLWRSSRSPDGRALALFFIFVALTYEKIFGTTGYPGPLQEKLTLSLLDAGIPRDWLVWLFGPVPWPLWLAIAAALRFSVVFPYPPLSAEAIEASGLIPGCGRSPLACSGGSSGADGGEILSPSRMFVDRWGHSRRNRA